MEPDAQAYSRSQVTDDFVERMLQIALQPKHQEIRQNMRRLADKVWFPNLNQRREHALAMIDKQGLPVPTLQIWGFNDRSAPLPLGLQLFERICAKTQKAELHVLNGAGHYVFRDQAEAFKRVVTSFCVD